MSDDFCRDVDDPTASIKYDEGKPRHDLIPPHVLDKLARLYAHGAEKYKPNNWTKGGPWGRYYAALQRHLVAFWGGEDLDPDSGMPHLVHALWNVAALMHFDAFDIGEDDRLKGGQAAADLKTAKLDAQRCRNQLHKVVNNAPTLPDSEKP